MKSSQYGDSGPGGRETYVYRPVIGYKYNVGGQEFVSDRYGIGKLAKKKEWAESVVAEYSIGDECEIFYDPKNPEQNALTLKLPPFGIFGPGIGLIFTIGGIFIFRMGKK